jgi:hypothetical protein
MLHIHARCKHTFQVFSNVSYICCECFIWILHMFAMFFKCFSGIFVSVSYACLNCFICFLLYIATIGYFKSRSGVAYVICVGSGRLHGRRSGRHRPTVGALLCDPNALCAHLFSLRGSIRTLVARTDVRA